MNVSELNAHTLERELEWFARLLDYRISTYFAAAGENDGKPGIESITPPGLANDSSEYAALMREFDMHFDERVVFILSLIPHVRPQALDILLTNNPITARPYSEFGGVRNRTHGAFLPTAETAVYLLAGADLVRRFEVRQLFDEQHYFTRQGLIRIEHQGVGEPFLNASITAGADALNRVTHGLRHKPDYSAGFPAKLIQTKLTWDDLILAPEIVDDIDHLNTWILRQREIVQGWNLEKAIKPGYRALFFGPPGTGKTLTATLLGANAGVDVYRIDLSMVVSKYIGETEKNLASVFDQAENKNWILFFDEADALFGKRTQTSSSNDRHANQEISYLLQRVEDFPGVVILASNIKANIDEAFARRFQSIIYFPLPDEVQRLRLWQNLLPDPSRLGASVDLKPLALKHELSGGSLVNVVRYAAVRATRLNRRQIEQEDLVEGINKELLKEGRTL
jgi:hypothetical protein